MSAAAGLSRLLGERGFLDPDFVVLAAMRAAHVKRDETDAVRAGLAGFGVFDTGIDALTGIRTGKSKYSHGHSPEDEGGPSHASVVFF